MISHHHHRHNCRSLLLLLLIRSYQMWWSCWHFDELKWLLPHNNIHIFYHLVHKYTSGKNDCTNHILIVQDKPHTTHTRHLIVNNWCPSSSCRIVSNYQIEKFSYIWRHYHNYSNQNWNPYIHQSVSTFFKLNFGTIKTFSSTFLCNFFLFVWVRL